MTVLAWDRMDERRFETGLDRGVLYPVGGSPVVWNGLTSIQEVQNRQTKDFFQDGVRVFQRSIAQPYSAKIQAYTVPNIVFSLVGHKSLAAGVNLHDGSTPFRTHLCYRTRIGSALEGVEFGYRLHLVYDLLINPDDVQLDTTNDQSNATVFGLTVNAIQRMWQNLPVNHISVDSTEVDPGWLLNLENQLYGTPTSDPTMPDLMTLLNSF